MRRSYLFPQFAGILFLLLFTLPVMATEYQAEHNITVQIQEVVKMEVGSGEIAFDLAHPKAAEPFPASTYPAYYTPTSTEQYIPVSVFANGATQWRLFISGVTNRGLGEGAIEWSLDGARWHPLRSTAQLLTVGNYTGGWLEFKVYFRLVLKGTEYANSDEYKVKVFYQLSSV